MTGPAWSAAELCKLELPGGGTLTAVITGADVGHIVWHVDYRLGDVIQTIDGSEESSLELARDTAWEVMQIIAASVLEERRR